MASNRVYFCIARNDLPQGLIYIKDLKPNTAQRSFVYEPVGQTSYLNPTNVVDFTAVTALATGNPGGGNHENTATAEYGLCAYLRDRVNANPGGNDDSLSIAEATAIANAIIDRVISADSLTLSDINTILVAQAGANTDLDGAGGASDSFGSVEDILRILAGEVYEVKANTVIELTAGNVFQSLAQRTAAISNPGFFAQGSFVSSDHANYLPFRKTYNTGALKISNGEGDLSKLNADSYQYTNTADFYYGGVAVAGKSAAQDIRGNTNVPATGIFRACSLYDEEGNLI
jgi:hypothetical protein